MCWMLDKTATGNRRFCNTHIAISSISKEKIALFCRFLSLCPHILPYISRRTTARCPRSDLMTYMITAFDLVISAFLVIFVRYTILTWMKVLIVNTSESTGGAAVAAHRLMDALRANGVEAEMLVRNRSTSKYAHACSSPQMGGSNGASYGNDSSSSFISASRAKDFLPSTSPMWARTSLRALSLRQPM